MTISPTSFANMANVVSMVSADSPQTFTAQAASMDVLNTAINQMSNISNDILQELAQMTGSGGNLNVYG